MRAPRGTGFLYVRRAWTERVDPIVLDGRAATWTSPETYRVRSDARRFESWESHVAGRIGLGVAADYAMALGTGAIQARVHRLGEALRARLAALPGVTVRDLGTPETRSGIVTFESEAEAPSAMKRRLRDLGIYVSVSSASWALLDMSARGLHEMVRASVHYFNTEEEIDRFCAAVDAGRR
jgi:selenocysteine lyase/cysteine desulfurase